MAKCSGGALRLLRDMTLCCFSWPLGGQCVYRVGVGFLVVMLVLLASLLAGVSVHPSVCCAVV